MLGFILGVLICYVALLSVGTFWEKTFHPELTTREAMRKFKLALVNILGDFFYMRHLFYPTLPESITNIVQDYSHPAFPISCNADLQNNTPVYRISFTRKQVYAEEELLRISKLIQLKFSDYIKNHKFNWRFFVEYHQIEESIDFYIYYEEAFFDRKPFTERYLAAAKEGISGNSGILRDEALDKELQNVK